MKATSASSSLAVQADRLILGCLLASCAAAVALGVNFDQFATGLVGALVLAALGIGSYMAARGTLTSSLLLAATLMSSVALHIQLGRGTLELHFGVFVTLALLLFYRDWRPIVAAAGLIAVHHVLFDRLQAGGLGVYCITEANFPRVVVHAVYVVVQTAAEIYIVMTMRQLAFQGQEMAALVEHVGDAGELALDVQNIAVETPGGRSLKRALLRVNDALLAVRHAVGSIQVAANEIAAGSTDLSHRTEHTASNLQQTASSMEQLAGNVRHSADSAANANALAQTAASAASRGGDVMHQVVASMDQISGSSRRIADIIGTIDGIAFQTNILALNAAVEAARAGEQGRGFAVVAGEVRTLAQRSAEAAREIKSLIGASVESVETGSRLVRDAGSSMEDIVSGVKRVSDIIGEISAATAEQSSGIGQMNNAVTQLDQMTQQNAALVEQSAAAAESMRDQAQRLAEAVSSFRLRESAAA